MKKIRMILFAMMALCIVVTGAYAEEPKVAGYGSVDVMTNYIWRGQKLSNSWVVQPAVGITYGGFSANIWANYDSDVFEATSSHSGHGEITETDITLSYTHSIGKLALTGGYIYYAFDGFNDTQEVFVTATYDTFLSPSLSVYYDYDEGNGAFIIAGISHTFSDLPLKSSLKLAATASYNFNNKIMGFDKDGDDFSNFYNADLSAALTIPITKALSVTPKVGYTFALSNDAKEAIKNVGDSDGHHNFWYGGVNLTLAF